MEIAITGASGLIGRALSAAVRVAGDRPIAVVRRAAKPNEDAIQWDPTTGRIDAAALEGLDGVVHLAGAGIGDKRWTEPYKREVLESRTGPTRLLAETLASLTRPPAVLVSGSAIGYYGDRGDEILTETSGAGDLFLSEVCQAWESAAQPALDAGIRVAYCRTGIVLDAHRGALSKLLPLFKLGLGGRMGSGRQWWSWVSIDDEVRGLRYLLDNNIHGPANLAAPNPVPNAEFARVLGQVLHRPSLLPIPSFGPKLLRGPQLAHELLFASQRVQPYALETHGFTFEHPGLETALRAVLDRPQV